MKLSAIHDSHATSHFATEALPAQLRVAIRRLRSALRLFEGWVPAPPAALVDDLRRLFATLGQARDSDVLGSGVATALAAAGAPPLRLPAGAAAVEPGAAARSDDTQRLLLAWIAWRAGMDEGAPAVTSSPTARCLAAVSSMGSSRQRLVPNSREDASLDSTATASGKPFRTAMTRHTGVIRRS